MKFRNLISISSQQWVDSFLNSLEEKGTSKKNLVARSIFEKESDQQVLTNVYGSETDKTKRTFNQTTSTLYKEFLTHLLIRHREYPDILLANLRKLLAFAEEEEFLRQAEITERVLNDCEAFDHKIGLFHLFQDHHFQNKYKAALYAEYTGKLRVAISEVSAYASIEEYYLNQDLGIKKKKGKWNKSDLVRHHKFYQQFFGKGHPDKIRIRARLFWLKTLKLNDYFSLSSKDSQSLSNDVFSLMRKRPYLYFNLPEIAEFSNLSYRIYTSFEQIEPREFGELFNSFLENNDDDRLLKLYPRVVQAMITSQARYYGGRAGLRFIDDPQPMDKEIEKGLKGLLPMVSKIRNRSSFTDKNDRLYGLETEALCRQHLPGENRLEAAKLFELIRVQEQQMQHVMGSHMVHVNLMHCYFWAKRWPQLLEEIEKYKRFIKAKGELNPLITQILAFSELIGKLMLREVEMTPSEIKAKSKEIFKDYPKWHEDMAVYSMKHLKLAG